MLYMLMKYPKHPGNEQLLFSEHDIIGPSFDRDHALRSWVFQLMWHHISEGISGVCVHVHLPCHDWAACLKVNGRAIACHGLQVRLQFKLTTVPSSMHFAMSTLPSRFCYAGAEASYGSSMQLRRRSKSRRTWKHLAAKEPRYIRSLVKLDLSSKSLRSSLSMHVEIPLAESLFHKS